MVTQIGASPGAFARTAPTSPQTMKLTDNSGTRSLSIIPPVDRIQLSPDPQGA